MATNSTATCARRWRWCRRGSARWHASQHIDTALLATRSDLVAFLRGDADARLATGWRHDLLGDGIRRLVAGKAALTFDGRGGLDLIAVPDAVE